MQVFLVGTLSLQHQVEGIGELAREPEPATVVDALSGCELDVDRQRVTCISFAFVLIDVTQLQ